MSKKLDMKTLGKLNGQVSSVAVQHGCQVEAFEKEGFSGKRKAIDRNLDELEPVRYAMTFTTK
jgi:hypothetical protein